MEAISFTIDAFSHLRESIEDRQPAASPCGAIQSSFTPAHDLQGSSLAQASGHEDREHSGLETSMLADLSRPPDEDFDATRSIDSRLGAAFMFLKFSSSQTVCRDIAEQQQ